MMLGERALDLKSSYHKIKPVFQIFKNKSVRAAPDRGRFAADKSNFFYRFAGQGREKLTGFRFQGFPAIRVKIAFKGYFIRTQTGAAQFDD